MKAEPLIEKGVKADTKQYLLLLYGSAASLLSFAGYTNKSIYDAIRVKTRRPSQGLAKFQIIGIDKTLL